MVSQINNCLTRHWYDPSTKTNKYNVTLKLFTTQRQNKMYFVVCYMFAQNYLHISSMDSWLIRTDADSQVKVNKL